MGEASRAGSKLAEMDAEAKERLTTLQRRVVQEKDARESLQEELRKITTEAEGLRKQMSYLENKMATQAEELNSTVEAAYKSLASQDQRNQDLVDKLFGLQKRYVAQKDAYEREKALST